MEKIDREETRKKIEKLNKEGGTKSTNFWKIKKQEEKQTDEKYDIIREEDNEAITDPKETREYTAEYFKKLYEARETKKGYEEITEKIRNKIKEIEKEMENKPPPPPVSTEEMRWVKIN